MCTADVSNIDLTLSSKGTFIRASTTMTESYSDHPMAYCECFGNSPATNGTAVLAIADVDQSHIYYVRGAISDFEERAIILIKQLPIEMQRDASAKSTDIKFGKMSFVANNEGKEIARLVYVRFKDGCHTYKLG